MVLTTLAGEVLAFFIKIHGITSSFSCSFSPYKNLVFSEMVSNHVAKHHTVQDPPKFRWDWAPFLDGGSLSCKL